MLENNGRKTTIIITRTTLTMIILGAEYETISRIVSFNKRKKGGPSLKVMRKVWV